MATKRTPLRNPTTPLRSALKAAESALATAVERYDAMGWYDGTRGEKAEAGEVEAALAKVTAALKA